MESMAQSNSCGTNPFSLGLRYGFLHPVIDIFFMQNVIVSQISNLNTLVWRLGQGGDVALGLIENCDLQNRSYVTFAGLFASLFFLCLMCYQNVGLVDLVPSDKIACRMLLLLVNRL